MYILAFDCSGNRVSAALSLKSKILASHEGAELGMQSETILKIINSLMDDAGIRFTDLSCVASTTGPGSFTGIRVGLAVAKSAGIVSKNLQVVGVSNFAINYFRATEQVKDFSSAYIILSALRGQFYLQKFSNSGGATQPILCSKDELLAEISSEKDRVICAGNALMDSNIYTQLEQIPSITLLPRFGKIKAAWICRFINELQEKNNSKLQAFQLSSLAPVPLYIMPPDAKRKLNP